MKRDEKETKNHKSIRKINIDDQPQDNDAINGETKTYIHLPKDNDLSNDKTKAYIDLPEDLDDFEFQPNYDDLSMFEDEFEDITDKNQMDISEAQLKDEYQKNAEQIFQRRGSDDMSQENINSSKHKADFLFRTKKDRRQTDKNKNLDLYDTSADKEEQGRTGFFNRQKLTADELEQRREIRKKRRSQNREILVVTYMFSALFVMMVGYLIYFNVYESKDVIKSSYNVRIESFNDEVTRGDILASDGTVLATTNVDDEGNEYRYYPYGSIYAHAVGTSDINLSGIELLENYDLLQSNANPASNAVQNLKGEKKPGDSIVTTLDTNLQEVAYNALGYNDGAVICIEPSTGRILAMVSKPDYDPNTLAQDYDWITADEDDETLINKTTSGLFAPGSIFKTVTTLAYMRSGADYQNYYYNCEGMISFGEDEYLTCFDSVIHGEENLESSFAYSCNSSFANIGTNLPENLLKETAESLYFNDKLPTDLSHVKSRVNLDETSTQWDIGATSIGQGEALVTPLQMVSIASAIANGGNLMKPYIVDEIRSTEGTRVSKNLPESAEQVMTTQEASYLDSLMRAVVDYGTATDLSWYSYDVAGKTGTAEVEGAGDSSWFIGYAPADDPKIAICVLVQNDEGYSERALPVVSACLSAYLGE